MQLRSLAQSRAVLARRRRRQRARAGAHPAAAAARQPWPVLLGRGAVGGRQVPAVPAALARADQRATQPVVAHRAYAEGELLGLLTPGHVGADVWRVHRLTGTGLGRGDAVLSVGADRLVGAVGLAAFVVLRRHRAAGVVGAARRAASRCSPWSRPGRSPGAARPAPAAAAPAAAPARPGLRALGRLPALHRRPADGNHRRHRARPLAARHLGAFGASQVAGAVPGPNGASPRDGALVAALVPAGSPGRRPSPR